MTALCGCGCGQPVPIAAKTRGAVGHVKGQPVRFVAGHSGRLEAGRIPGADELGRGRREAQRRFDLGECEFGCGKRARDRHHLDGDPTNNAPANVMRLCRRCHMLLDGRLTAVRPKVRGAEHPAAKLTEDDVRAIRARRPTEPLADLAREYGIAQTTVSAIALRRAWAHVDSTTSEGGRSDDDDSTAAASRGVGDSEPAAAGGE